ncbi:hypothetical protein [Corynebacterium lubricantis]|uniref:hypothetical protein n=1 Tax=Corynebacterium lubricantis TaxID=541095 RepID=UPI00038044B1|nr:hypothetical protein [Corynebacterium lubricantis]
MTQKVLVDANVLASRTVLDWLFHLKQQNKEMYSLLATDDILAETIRVSRRCNPKAPSSTITKRIEMVKAVMDDSELTFPGDLEFTGNDKHDYHVHAAASSNNVHMLLTFNDAKDFTKYPDDETYEVYHPDEFFDLVISSNPACLGPAVQNQFEYWGRRKNPKKIDQALKDAGCPEFVCTVKQELSELAQRM